jgi:hypothetical protein
MTLSTAFAMLILSPADNDQILISDETKEKVEGLFTFNEELVEIQSGGKVKVYTVTGKKSS